MEIKPVGIDRDKQVAEIRGECYCLGDIFLHHRSGENGNLVECSKCGERFGALNPPNKPYSTDISCAMELWEEMKREKAEMSLMAIDNAGYKYRCAFNIFPNAYMHYGETEADAISGCYMKWKTNE